MNKMLDEIFKLNPMLVIMTALTVILLLAFLAGALYLIAYLIVRNDHTEDENYLRIKDM